MILQFGLGGDHDDEEKEKDDEEEELKMKVAHMASLLDQGGYSFHCGADDLGVDHDNEL